MCKSRLVAQGFTQQEGIDFNNTFSLMAKLTAVRVIAAIAVRNDWELEQTDVDATYLNASLKEDIYSDSKNPFHTNPKWGVSSALPYSVGILLSFGGVIHSTYPQLRDCSLGHVIWATGCRDMINLIQQYHGKGFFTFELMTRISVKS